MLSDTTKVALRFPGCNDALVVSGSAVRDTVGGSDWHTDGLRQGKKHSFSLLVGVALSDTTGTGQGNLCVWPGSHLRVHRMMRPVDGKVRRANGGYSDADGPLPDLGSPVELLLRAGDVVFAHSETAHCGGPMLCSSIRSMLYFRVRHRDWRTLSDAGSLVDDMWVDLEGVQARPAAIANCTGCD